MTKEEIIQMYIYDLKSKAVQTEATISVIKTLEREQEKAQELAATLGYDIIKERLEWLYQKIEETPPFKQSFNNLSLRRSKLLEAKLILEKEGL